MFYKKLYAILLIFAVVFVIVEGSCLEYGHSCWGAHGKRSGGNKALRAAVNLHSGDVKLSDEKIENNDDELSPHKALFENIEELHMTASAENPSQRVNSAEEAIVDPMESSLKLKNILRENSRNFKLHRLNNNNNLDDSLEPLARNVLHHNDRWRQLPLYNLKHYPKTTLNTAENDLLQQLERHGTAKNTMGGAAAGNDDGYYYDFQ